jgi:hypothetical protein
MFVWVSNKAYKTIDPSGKLEGNTMQSDLRSLTRDKVNGWL